MARRVFLVVDICHVKKVNLLVHTGHFTRRFGLARRYVSEQLFTIDEVILAEYLSKCLIPSSRVRLVQGRFVGTMARVWHRRYGEVAIFTAQVCFAQRARIRQYVCLELEVLFICFTHGWQSFPSTDWRIIIAELDGVCLIKQMSREVFVSSNHVAAGRGRFQLRVELSTTSLSFRCRSSLILIKQIKIRMRIWLWIDCEILTKLGFDFSLYDLVLSTDLARMWPVDLSAADLFDRETSALISLYCTWVDFFFWARVLPPMGGFTSKLFVVWGTPIDPLYLPVGPPVNLALGFMICVVFRVTFVGLAPVDWLIFRRFFGPFWETRLFLCSNTSNLNLLKFVREWIW